MAEAKTKVTLVGTVLTSPELSSFMKVRSPVVMHAK